MAYDNVIDVRGLAKTYGRITALENLTLQVAPGEIFGFLGPNGAGKTTSVKILTGLTRASAGSGTVLGFALGDRRARRKLGYLPELFRYQEWLSAREIVQFHARICGRRLAQRDVEEALDIVGLKARMADRLATFSKGMQQRVGLAVALVGRPDLVILDEPTSALDPVGRTDVREILRYVRAAGTAVLLNSHLLSEVQQVCDRVAVITRGRIVAHGPVGEILGAESALRIRARADGTPLIDILQPFGSVATEDGCFIVHGVGAAQAPAMARALVAAGADIFSIEPLSATLEERFLELIGGSSE